MENYYLTGQKIPTIVTAPADVIPEYLANSLTLTTFLPQHDEYLHARYYRAAIAPAQTTNNPTANRYLKTQNNQNEYWELSYYANNNPKPKLSYWVDYARLTKIHRQTYRNKTPPDLIRACFPKGITHHRIIDCGCGFGDDSVLLSMFGATVIAYESNPLLACLADSALNKLNLKPQLQLIAQDAFTADLASQQPTCIYLDPMFNPAKLGTPGIKAQLYRLCNQDSPEPDFGHIVKMLIPLNCRVVVKRHPKAPQLLPQYRPTRVISGTQIRFDIYHLANN